MAGVDMHRLQQADRGLPRKRDLRNSVRNSVPRPEFVVVLDHRKILLKQELEHSRLLGPGDTLWGTIASVREMLPLSCPAIQGTSRGAKASGNVAGGFSLIE